MKTRHTSATPAGVPRSRAKHTRRIRKQHRDYFRMEVAMFVAGRVRMFSWVP